MSISIKDFKEGRFKVARNEVKDHPVLICLRTNKQAFTIKEIGKKTKMKLQTVRGMVRTLEKKGLIAHKSPYYIYKKHL